MIKKNIFRIICFRVLPMPLISILIIFFSIVTAFQVNAGTTPTVPEIRFTSPLPGTAFPYTRTLDEPRISLETSVAADLKAYIEPVSVNETVIWQEKTLMSGENVECRRFPCKKHWNMDLSAKDLSLNEFPRMQLVWHHASEGALPVVFVKAAFESAGSGNKKPDTFTVNGVFSGKGNQHLEPRLTLDMKDAAYTEKSNLYLARRELGFKADKQWRYSMDGHNLVLQSRVDLPFSEVQAVQVITGADQMPERIQFSVDTQGNGRRDRFILFEQIHRNNIEIKNDRAILTLDLRDTLKQMGIDPQKAVLMEPILFFPMEFNTYIQKKPLHQIVFCGEKATDDSWQITPRVTHAGGRTFLDFNFLKGLRERDIWNAKWKSLSLDMRFNGPEVLTIETLRLFDAFNRRVPLLVQEPRKAFQSWGGRALPLGPFEQLTSFRPLMWPWKEQTREKIGTFFNKYSQESFQDADCALSSSKTWYNLSKTNDAIHLKGIFSDNDAALSLSLNPVDHPVSLKFEGSVVKSIMVETLAGKSLQLPLAFLMDKGMLQLPENTEISLKIRPKTAFRDQKGHDEKQGTSPGTLKKNREKLKDTSSRVFQKWDLTVTSREKDVFTSTRFPDGVKKRTPAAWHTSEPVIRGALWPFFSGKCAGEGSVVVDRSGLVARYPLSSLRLFPDSGRSMSDHYSGGRFITIEQDQNNMVRQKNRKPSGTAGIFDITVDRGGAKRDFSQLEWWIKKATLSFIPLDQRDQSIVVDSNNHKLYLFPEKKGLNRFLLTLPDQEFMIPLSITIPGKLPNWCRVILKTHGEEIPLSEGINDISSLREKLLSSHLSNPKSDSWIIEIIYQGGEPLISIPVPVLAVSGLKRTFEDEYRRLSLKVGNKEIPIPPVKFGPYGGKWVDLGTISLDKGIHDIQAAAAPFFRIKRLTFKTDTEVQLPSDVEGDRSPSLPLWEKLIFMTLKAAMVLVAVGVVYLFRLRIKAGFFLIWEPFAALFAKFYWFLPDEAWTMLWLLGSLGLYGLGLYGMGMSHKSQGENYAFTFGGMFMIVFLWHLGRLLRGWLHRHFPEIAVPVYRGRGTLFFAWALVILIFTALLVAAGLEPLAEQTAIIVYYCLVVGVVGEIWELKSQKAETEST